MCIRDSVSIFQTGETTIPEKCSKCLTNEHFGATDAWELNVTRVSFENGRQEEMFIRVQAQPNFDLKDWKISSDEVTVSLLSSGLK